MFLALQVHTQQRRLQPSEQLFRELIIVLGLIAAEVNIERIVIRANVLERPLHQIFQILGQQPYHALRLQVFDGADSRQRLVPARLREQRHVVPQALIAVGFAQIEYAGRAGIAVSGVGQIRARRDNRDAGNFERPVTRIADDDEHAQGTAPCRRGG